jgi:hypothetical protein
MSARRPQVNQKFLYERITKAIKIEPGLTNWQLTQRFGSRHELFYRARKELGIDDPKSEYLTEADMRKAKSFDRIDARLHFGKRARR